MRIKFVSYNICHGRYLDRVVEFLQQEKADIIQFQEAATVGRDFKYEEINIANELKRQLNLNGVYERLFWVEDEGRKWDLGLLTLAKFPIIISEVYQYEAGKEIFEGGYEALVKGKLNIPRKLLKVKLDVGGRELMCVNTHFTLTEKAQVTEKQLKAADRMKDLLVDDQEYILSGDMNTPYKTETYEKIARGLVDISEPTKPTLHPKLHQVGSLGYHVDYVFYGGKWIKHLNTSRVPIVDGSDHLPVVVEFELENT